jgi:tetratricopeptide (TPR) repeat protein
MTPDELINHGNHFRSITEPDKALACYAQAFIQDPNLGAAYNNYGNVIREMGYPDRAIGFLLNAIAINENDSVAQFNLAVAYLLSGNLEQGWPQYERRWKFEHLNGKLPQLPQPRWEGQDLTDKTIMVTGEQGHGDSIQFCRFIEQLVLLGATVYFAVDNNLKPLFTASFASSRVIILEPEDTMPAIDYWSPVMSLPGYLTITYKNLPHKLQYLTPSQTKIQSWAKRLGLKKHLRVGFCWSGRRDSWINQHKAIPFDKMLALIKRNPDYEWVNLQVDSSAEEETQLSLAGVTAYPASIGNWDDTAGLVHHLDVVIAVDTAVGHLAGAMGRPFWLPLNKFGQDWRWLLNRNDSPWYPSCRIFRQQSIGNWDSPLEQIHNNLKLFKI